ncbi:MAG TPA: hypothetical protein VFA84_04530 [Acidimicrobiales bacterium]|nr:hypothetical protein [Acidimicrobiales bacterium]
MGSTGRQHLTLGRAALALLAACLAAALASVVVLRGHRQDTAQTTVFVTRVLPNGPNNDINTAIADFETALRLPQVDAQVSKQTGVAAGTVHDGTTVSRLGASSAVRVSYTGSGATAPVVVAAVHAALVTLAQQQVDAATEATSAAQVAATRAADALTALDQSLNTNDIDTEYARHSDNLVSLENQQAVSPSPGLPALIASERSRVAELAAAEPQYQQLKAAYDSAQGTLATSQQALTDANSRLRAAADTTILTPPTVAPASRVAELARADGAAAAAAAVLVLGLAVVADAVADRRAARAGAAEAPHEHGHNGQVSGVAVTADSWSKDGVLRAGHE